MKIMQNTDDLSFLNQLQNDEIKRVNNIKNAEILSTQITKNSCCNVPLSVLITFDDDSHKIFLDIDDLQDFVEICVLKKDIASSELFCNDCIHYQKEQVCKKMFDCGEDWLEFEKKISDD